MLRDELTHKQRLAGMTDAEFALLLGMKRATWQATRLGYRRINRMTALRVQVVFPDLANEARDYLLRWTPRPEAENGAA